MDEMLDFHPVPLVTMKELSTFIFDEYVRALEAKGFEIREQPMEEQLAALRFFDLRRGVATVAGLLLLGRNVRYHLPGAYVQYLKFSGRSRGDVPVDQAEIDGDLGKIIREADVRIRSYNVTKMEPIGSFREKLISDYPEWALRELMLNALIHRDYSGTTPVRFSWFEDRIEIQNPGGPYGGVTAATLTQRSAYRNPVLAEAMKVLGYVYKFGDGIQRAKALLAENGNPPPEFESGPDFFSVKIPRRPS